MQTSNVHGRALGRAYRQFELYYWRLRLEAWYHGRDDVSSFGMIEWKVHCSEVRLAPRRRLEAVATEVLYKCGN